MPNASKVAEVEAIKGYLNDAVAALLTEYRGLKVKDMGDLRTDDVIAFEDGSGPAGRFTWLLCAAP